MHRLDYRGHSTAYPRRGHRLTDKNTIAHENHLSLGHQSGAGNLYHPRHASLLCADDIPVVVDRAGLAGPHHRRYCRRFYQYPIHHRGENPMGAMRHIRKENVRHRPHHRNSQNQQLGECSGGIDEPNPIAVCQTANAHTLTPETTRLYRPSAARQS